MRILLFGGTFDPPHCAHVELATRAANAAGCERVVYIPAAQSPLKLDAPDTAPEHRLAMLAIAVRDRPNAHISTAELERGGVSYFIDTLEAIRARVPAGTDLCFLVGADQALHFPRWRDWQRILEEAEPVLVVRPPWTRATLVKALREVYGEAGAARWIDAIVDAPLSDVSSTVLRDRLERGEPTDSGLDDAVGAYITEHGLYRADPDEPA